MASVKQLTQITLPADPAAALEAATKQYVDSGLATKLGTTATAAAATKLATARTIALGGLLGGSTSFDGSGNVTIMATMAANALSISNTSGLQSALDGKQAVGQATIGTVGGYIYDSDGAGSVGVRSGSAGGGYNYFRFDKNGSLSVNGPIAAAGALTVTTANDSDPHTSIIVGPSDPAKQFNLFTVGTGTLTWNNGGWYGTSGYAWQYNGTTTMTHDKNGNLWTGGTFQAGGNITASSMTIGTTRVPVTFVQSADPGSSAVDGDLWLW